MMSVGALLPLSTFILVSCLVIAIHGVNVAVDETTAVGSTFKIDVGAGNKVSFKSNVKEFTLKSDGTLTVKTKLDYETNKEYKYVVVISGPSGSKEEELKVLINDINDEAPKFVRPFNPKYFYPDGLPQNLTAVLYRQTNTLDAAEVYRVRATDMDKNANLTYDFFPYESVDAGIKENFRIVPNLGTIVRKGNKALPSGVTVYKFPVRVRDMNSVVPDKAAAYITVTAYLNKRAPQIAADPYLIGFPEKLAANSKIGFIHAVPLNDKFAPLKWTLTPLQPYDDPWPFLLNETTGELTVTKSFTFNRTCKYEWHAKVMVNESNTYYSEAKVSIVLVDTNDYRPFFQQSVYFTGTPVLENVSTSDVILRIPATDPDMSSTTDLKYTLHGKDKDTFKIATDPVTSEGVVTRVKPLDYEYLGPENAYKLTVTVTDGIGPSATASVVIYVKNVNNKIPIFAAANNKIVSIQRDSVNKVIFQAHAYDADGSTIKYYFLDANTTKSQVSHFRVDEDSGAVTYSSKAAVAISQQKLTFIAIDNGDCATPCQATTKKLRSQPLNLTVRFLDKNTEAPKFQNCPKVLKFSEATKVGDTVLNLTAVDGDDGLDGTVFYELRGNKYTSNPSKYMSINNKTGSLKLVRSFDHEDNDEKFAGLWNIWITVLARDSGKNGTNQLRSYCTMRLEVEDVNDNAPKFDSYPYVTGIFNQTYTNVKKVIQVYAIDYDKYNTKNSRVSYKKGKNFPAWLDIDSTTGWISIKPPVNPLPNSVYVFEVQADDTEPMVPPTLKSFSIAEVRIYVVNDRKKLPPEVTITSELSAIDETLPAYTSVVNGTVNLSDKEINTETIPGSTKETNEGQRYFRLFVANGKFYFRKQGDLDATIMDHIYIHGRIERSLGQYGTGTNRYPIYTDIRQLIQIKDVNNKIPSFITFGIDRANREINMPEDAKFRQKDGRSVITLYAADKDVKTEFRTITYGIKKDGISDANFTVVGDKLYVKDSVTGFDFEGPEKSYAITVTGQDGAPSALPDVTGPNKDTKTIHVIITDVNDNSPTFNQTLYTVPVSENWEVGKPFFQLQANDRDVVNKDTLIYTMDKKNIPFGVNSYTGHIYPTRPLDFEGATKTYTSVFKVFDGKFESQTTVTINVVDVNDNPPVFDDAVNGIITTARFNVGSPPSPLKKLKMSDKDAGTSSIRVTAEGHWTVSPYSYFGIPSGTTDLRVLDSNVNPAKNILRSDKKYHFTLKAFDGNLTAYAQAIVEVHNPSNLNAPCFKMASLHGFQPVGSTVVGKVEATDADGNPITFSLPDKPAGYSINPSTGVITSSTPAAANKVNSLTSFKVRATDGTKSMTGVYTVTVIPKSSGTPTCKSRNVATYYRNIKLKAVFYAVQAANIQEADRRKMSYTVTGLSADFYGIKNLPELDAGGLYLKKLPTVTSTGEFDPKASVQITNSNRQTVTCIVTVLVKDANIYKPNIYITPAIQSIPETTTTVATYAVPRVLATVKVNDTDTNDKTFVISMKQSFDTGVNPGIEMQTLNATHSQILLLKTLDREKLTTGSGPAFVKVVVLARDTTPKFMTATATYTLTVTDQEEAPSLPATLDAYVDVSKGANAPVNPAAISVNPAKSYTYEKDPTSPVWKTNPPFVLTPSSNSFSLKTARDLKSEKGGSIAVPVIVKSAAGKTLSTVTVTVGFQTGQLPNTDKQVKATVSFGWAWYWTSKIEPINLGSLYGQRLYGRDALGVTYSLDSNPYPNYFKLNTTTGLVNIIDSVPSGNYTLKGKVSRGSSTATATMNIEVTAVGANALANVASFRLKNTNIGTLVDRKITSTAGTSSSTSYGASILQQIRAKIAEKIPTVVSKVQIVSLEEDRAKKTVNVYYVASGSPYYTPSKLNTLIFLNKGELEKIPGVTLGSLPVDKCAEEPEKCSNGCTNQVVVNQEKAGIHRESTATMMGLQLKTVAVCGCGHPGATGSASVCGPGSCLNDGNCTVDAGTKTAKCKCPATFEGPRCQQLFVNFGSADGYVFTEPMGSCGDAHINFEFVTQQTGRVLLLYTGPLTSTGQDKLAVELNSGKPVVTITVNGKTDSVTVNSPNLSDGKWHRLDIHYKDGTLQLMVDFCANAPLLPTDGTDVPNRASCYGSKVILTAPVRTFKRRLNVAASPIQVGGSTLTSDYPTGLLGGIGRLRVNGELRNLVGGSRSYNKKADTNSKMTASCYDADKDPVCGINSLCRPSLVGSADCECKPGYRKNDANKCTRPTKIVDYRPGGYTYWKLKTKPADSAKATTRFSIRFRTRQTSGSLMYVVGRDYYRNQSLELRIIDSRAQLVINIGDYSFTKLTVPNKNVSDGAWHTLEMKRILNSFELLLDGGDFYNYAFLMGSTTSTYNYMKVNEYILSGMRVKWTRPADFLYEYSYMHLNDSCLTDARYEGGWMPFKKSDENEKTAVATVDRQANRVDNCPNNNVCPTPDTCPKPLICLVTVWRPLTRPSCGCPGNQVLIGSLCIAVGVCSPNPCYRGTCLVNMNVIGGYVCNCPRFYSGKHCEIYAGAATASLGAGIIVLIVIFIILIILAILLYIYFTRCRSRSEKLLDYPDEDSRENVLHYDEEGAGEEDHEGYDLTHLRKPIHDIHPSHVRPLKGAPPHDNSDLGHFLHGRLKDAEHDPHGPPQDYSLDYGYEGQGSVVDDLSSLGSGTSDGSQHYDHLHHLGPKFRPLSDLYNHNHHKA